MEFTQDVAVLQSALQLAEKLCQGNLKAYHRRSCNQALSIIEDSISEITHGLAQDLTLGQQHHTKLRLAAILVTMVTSSDKAEVDQDEWDYFAGVKVALPWINWDFFMDVMEKCCLTPYLLEILQNFSEAEGAEVLKEILTRLQESSASEDAQLLVKITNYLLLQSNKYVPSQAVNKTLDLAGQIIQCINKVVIGRDDPPVRAFILIAMLNLLNALHVGKSHISQKISCAKSGHNFDDFVTYMEKFEKMSEKDVEESFNEFSEVHKKKKVTCVEMDPFGNQADFLVASLLDVIKLLLKSVSAADLMKIVRPILTNYCFPEKDPLLPLKLIQNILKSTVVNMESLSKSPKFNDTKPGILDTLKLLKQIREKFSAAVMESEKKKPIMEKITEAVKVVDGRLEEYEVSFGWLIQQDFTCDERILECIEQNAPLLTSVDFLLQMIDKLYLLNMKNNVDIHKRIKQLVFEVYKGLSVELQNHVMYHVHSQFAAEELFCVDPDAFLVDLTMTFNRLVSAQGQFDKAMQEVSVLALQSPKQVISKLVLDAMHNSGQTRIYIQLLEGIPTACRMVTSSGVSVLCDLLHCQLKKVSLSRAEEQNTIRFIHKLMQTSAAEPEGGMEDEALLSTSDLIKSCVLPYLQLSRNREWTSAIPLPLALQFLQVSLENTLCEGGDWLCTTQSLPLMLCLCEMIDNCSALWEEERSVTNMDVLKEHCVAVLELMVKVVVSQEDKLPAKAVCWLYNTLHQRVEWTTGFHLIAIFQMSCPDKYPMFVPLSLETVLELPEAGWQTFHDPVYDDDIFTLVVLAKISDASLQMVMDYIRPQAFQGETKLHQRVVTALAQVLSDSTVSEWVRVLTLAKWLYDRGLWSTAPRILTGFIPLLDFTGIRSELGILHLCKDVMTVLAGSSWTNICSVDVSPVWSHISKAVLTCVNSLCMPGMTAETTDKHTSRFALCHTFCLLCHLMASQPIGCLENLFVMSLDVLSSYENIASLLDENATNSTVQEADQQRRAMLDSVESCPEVQKITLLKKLN